VFLVPNHPGATHLYLLDFVPDNLPELKETIHKKYPDVKVRLTRPSLRNPVDILQVTTLHADAADEAAISSVCEQALKDEGRLDVFFANVSCIQLRPCSLN
jgi:NAD(P)-dependent dehydrogenase (short-subunit alcohol dehydrogenase family)